MAVTKPRNRVVLFRLTEEEYESLQAACSAGSARSLSDYARTRILDPVNDRSAEPASGSNASRLSASASAPNVDQPSLDQLDQRLAELKRAVDNLTQLFLKNSPARPAPENGNGAVNGTEAHKDRTPELAPVQAGAAHA